MEEDLVLLLITVSCQRDVMKNIDYYVYRAADRAAGGKPSLTLLKRPPAPYISFYAEHTGILHCGNSHHRPQLGSESGISLRPHVQVAESSYIIAALKTLPSMLPNSMFRGDGRLARDIAVINNELRFVELRVRLKESKVSEGDVFEDGWMAIIWTRPISNGVWCKKFKVDTRDMDLNNNPYVKKLPKVFNDEDMILPPFKRIEICQPTLGLHEDGSCIVYFMIKKRRQDRDAWVLAVDMKLNTIVGITSFSAARNTFIRFAYHDSRISKYLPKIALDPHGT
ncbi:hypothetical protein QOZ80_7BG0599630 [Eleusine coracana subsp. coracana]|nr:hypothetical protein QOZ80_7BG0599630 [Eleusine coracana subsp. coracana]